MSILIKKTTGEIFDLPNGYVIEAEKNNPAFTTAGSKTISIDFPNTPANRKLLLNSNRMDKAQRPDTFPVLVESDALCQQGLMAINSGFSAGIGFDEAEMYNKMGEIRLPEIPDLPVLEYPGTYEQKLTALLQHLRSVMRAEVVDDYFVFPVILKYELVESTNYFLVANELDLTDTDNDNRPNGRLAELKAMENRKVLIYESKDVWLDVPRGWGVSPYLRVSKILELIFQHFGFTISNNVFKNHRQLQKLVVLNNVMDTIVPGKLNYKDLMPDITVKAFFDFLYAKFGFKYFIDSNSRNVSFEFLQDILDPDSASQIDFTKFKTEEPVVSWTSPKQLRLLANREISYASVAGSTFEEFLLQNGNQFTQISGNNTTGATNLFQKEISRYIVSDLISNSILLNSSDFFDWDKKSGIEYEEIKMDDLSVPLMRFRQFHIYLAYLVGYQLKYTDQILENEKTDLKETSSKLAFAFAWRNTQMTGLDKFNYFFASQFNRDEQGNFMYDNESLRYDISLTINREDGLYNRFWKNYDAFLRHSNFEVKCNIKLPLLQIFKLQMSKSVLLNSQPLLPYQLRYRLNDKNSITDATFRTLRLYEPFDLESEQHIPVYENQKFRWKGILQTNPDIDIFGTEGIDYTVVSGRTNLYIMIGEEKVLTNKINMGPPTQQQFDNQEERIFVNQYTIMENQVVPIYWDITETVTYTPEQITY